MLVKDLIGKWFSNVSGKPNDYYYVLEFRENSSNAYSVTYINVALKGKEIKVVKSMWSYLRMWQEPITDLITLTKVRHKAIKGVLK